MKKFTGALFKLFAPAADAETFAATNEDLTSARVQLTEALQRRRNDQKPCFLNILDQNDLAGVAGLEKDMMIADNALLILADGVENVEAAIANVMLRSAHVPDPITSDFVRDTIKFDTPGQTISRIAAQDIFIGGEKISSGTPLFLSLASANEGTSSNVDFSFGMGRHKCIGEQLAISMITTFCSQLAERKPQTNISGLHYAAMFGHKWPRGVTLTPTC
jgi:cytochrome P450